jgi:hypothetical protein
MSGPYRIVLEADEDLPRGWYGYGDANINEYIHNRVDDVSDAIEFVNKTDCANVMDDMREYGYKCRSVPSFSITVEY